MAQPGPADLRPGHGCERSGHGDRRPPRRRRRRRRPGPWKRASFEDAYRKASFEDRLCLTKLKGAANPDGRCRRRRATPKRASWAARLISASFTTTRDTVSCRAGTPPPHGRLERPLFVPALCPADSEHRSCDLSGVSLDLTEFLPGRHLIQFQANKMQDFRNFVLHNCIVILTQVYLQFRTSRLRK